MTSLMQYIVIDFEYAAPNPRGYDIANHFHEWRADYHHPTMAHSLQPHFPYPTRAQRENFIRAYLGEAKADWVDLLDREVRIWSPASSVFWALWGVVQAEDQAAAIVEGRVEKPEFDYLVCRGLHRR